MAAQERSTIDDMVAEARANVGRDAGAPTTGGSTGSAEPEGVPIRRHSSEHIQGQAKSGEQVVA